MFILYVVYYIDWVTKKMLQQHSFSATPIYTPFIVGGITPCIQHPGDSVRKIIAQSTHVMWCQSPSLIMHLLREGLIGLRGNIFQFLHYMLGCFHIHIERLSQHYHFQFIYAVFFTVDINNEWLAKHYHYQLMQAILGSVHIHKERLAQSYHYQNKQDMVGKVHIHKDRLAPHYHYP